VKKPYKFRRNKHPATILSNAFVI